jgi:hypothetical protein
MVAVGISFRQGEEGQPGSLPYRLAFKLRLTYRPRVFSIQYSAYLCVMVLILGHKKGEAFPVTGRGGPYGCETSRLPHFL